MRQAIQDIAPVMDFNGSSAVVEVAHASDLMISTGSWGVWAMIRRKATAPGFFTLMNKCSSSAWTDGYGMSLVVSGSTDPQNAVLRFYLNYSTIFVSITVGHLLNTWHHYSATYDGAVLRAYVDGVEVGQTVSAGTITSNTQKLFIGAGQFTPAGTASYFTPGRMADAFVSNQVLTPEEIKQQMGRVLPASKLVSMWKLNDGPSATSAADSVGSNTGTITAAVNSAFGARYSRRLLRSVPYSIRFTGASGSKITLDAAATTSYGTGNFTFACFVRPNLFASNPAFNVIFSGYSANVNGQRGFIVAHDANNAISAYLDSGTQDIITTDTLSKGRWHHVGLVRNGDTATIYIDGIPSVKGTGFSARSCNSSVAGRLGEHPAAVGTFNFNSFMAEPGFFGRALSDAEMLSWARNGISSVSPTSLTASYLLTEGSGASIADSSGNGHTATLSTAVWTTESPVGVRTAA